MPTSDLSQHLHTVRRQLAATAWRVLRDADDADDAIQDTLTHIWARRRRVLAHPNPPALILRICFQCSIDRLRVRTRQQTFPLPFALPHRNSSPDSAMVGQEMHDEIMHQIALLPSQQSEAIYLRVIEQMPYADVAAALGCDESTARVHIRRAREKLRQTLAHLLPREVCHD